MTTPAMARVDAGRREGLSTGAVAPVLVGMATLLLVISLLGPAWLHVAANSVTGAPAADLSFQDLNHALTVIPATGWQKAYFDWLAWTLVVVTAGLAILACLARHRSVAGAVGVLSLAGLVATVFAVKGLLSWSQLIDTVPDVRVGAYLLIVGYLLLLALGVARSRSSR